MKIQLYNDIGNDKKYDELAAEWQYQMVRLFNETVRKYKVDSNKAKEICGDFANDLATLQNQGEIQFESKECRPVICFQVCIWRYRGSI